MTDSELNRRRWIIYLLLCFSYMMAFFHRYTPGVLSNELAGDLGLTATQLGTLSSLYFYAYGIVQIPVGVFTDRFGVRVITTGGMIIMTLGAFLFGIATNTYVIYFARVLLGLGSAVFFVSTLRTISVWFARDRFTTLLGWTSLQGNLGALLAATPYSVLLMVMNWRDSYYLFAVVGLAISFVLWRIVRDRPEDIDMEPDFNTARTPQNFSDILLGLKEVFKNLQFWRYFTIAFIILGSTMSLSGMWLVPYMTHVYEFSRNLASSLVVVMTVGVMLGAALLGLLEKRIRSRVKMIKISVTTISLIWGFILWQGGKPSFITLLILIFVMGFIRMFVLTSFTSIENFFPTLKGSAKGVMNISPFLGTIIFNTLIGWRLDATWAGEIMDGSRVYTQTGYQQSFLIIFLFVLLALFLSFGLKEDKES